jgi:serine/threonine protein kinase
MPTVSTSQEFLSLLGRSRLLDPASLKVYVRKLRKRRVPPRDLHQLVQALVGDDLLTPYQAEQLARGKWHGFYLGRYKILQPLGTGDMGRVFLCHDHRMKRRVAVKIMAGLRCQTPAARERFAREGRAVAALDHPNVIRAFDSGRDGDRHFLVMEYVDGVDLSWLVQRQGPLSPPRAAHYIRQAALGLQHAFEAGLVHRDVKPSNLVLDQGGTVKVLDMGLARFYDDEEDDLTERADEGILGNADYVAPEQVRDSHEVDVRADVYALGASLYFLLAGHPPFPEGTYAEKLVSHRLRQPTPISELRPDVPARLGAVVNKMMAKTPEQRYPTPMAVASALEPWTSAPIAPPTPEELARPDWMPAKARIFVNLKARDQRAEPDALLHAPQGKVNSRLRVLHVLIAALLCGFGAILAWVFSH